jgi:hypothetical protein
MGVALMDSQVAKCQTLSYVIEKHLDEEINLSLDLPYLNMKRLLLSIKNLRMMCALVWTSATACK